MSKSAIEEFLPPLSPAFYAKAPVFISSQ